ncbi:MAG: hypothetical protein Q8Q59_12360 [Luteolibacter sp.]|jgi:hypothetical protein|nr:hypothetical protein [Luteolibacter sp.]
MILHASSPVLAPGIWLERADAHRARAERHTGPARERRDRGLPHPIADFLFEYYPFPFALLENWQPGTGVALEWESPTLPARFPQRWYAWADGHIMTDPGKIGGRERQRLGWMMELLEATRDRAPNFACHGMHEWAMVYRGKSVRHEKTLKLRLPQAEIDALVETRAICCSHHDAFRFFAAAARPFNRVQPDLDSRVLLEQPGCLHANMDLYKWAAKAMPWTGSELLLDCFELAVELRELDMRASPYDLADWGREPVCIETADGRRVYECEQKRLASMAQPLRKRLIEVLCATLAEAG